jgi:uncharacterized protein YcbX
MASEIGCIESLWRYPVRSMRGEELASVEIATRGVVGDRCYCVVDLGETAEASASFVPTRWAGLLHGVAAFEKSPRADAPPPPVTIGFEDGSKRSSEDPDIADWLTGQLGHPVALWRDADAGGAALAGGRAEATGAATGSEGAPAEAADAPVRLYDRSPIHLVTTASLKRASALHPEGRFDAVRFRPNIVLDTGSVEDFLEEKWIGATLALGPELRIELSEPCERCALPTLPQGALERDPKIGKTVAAHNANHMGAYARVVQPGTLRRGDRAELL